PPRGGGEGERGPPSLPDPRDALPQRLAVDPQVAPVGEAAEALGQLGAPLLDARDHEARGLAVAGARVQDPVHRADELGVAELAGDAERVGQVEMADPEDVDALDRTD